jgi:hydroxymethylpyrimidine/phosphomethylpyrimidine kinase
MIMNTSMTIAGSDSGGGAGIQADLKTFAARGVFGTSAVTALTAQNTLGVTAVQEVAPEFVAAQIDAVLKDIGAGAVKTGMVSSVPLIEAIAAELREWNIVNLVVDPVMVARSGDKLLRDDAITTLSHELLPLAAIVTPNRYEAEILSGIPIRTRDDMERAARAIHALGPKNVVVKGGDIGGESPDVLFDGETVHFFSVARLRTSSTHGTGCTFSAAITAELAKGMSIFDAVQVAKAYVTAAIQQAPGLGGGHGPVQHFPQML